MDPPGAVGPRSAPSKQAAATPPGAVAPDPGRTPGRRTLTERRWETPGMVASRRNEAPRGASTHCSASRGSRASSAAATRQRLVHAPAPCNWTQWGHDGAHSAPDAPRAIARAGPRARRARPFTDQEMADTDGDLLVRYQVPLPVDDDVYVEVKSGSLRPLPPRRQGEISPTRVSAATTRATGSCGARSAFAGKGRS